jgi:hypothetical protein
MSKDFITVDVRKPEYQIVRSAFVSYLNTKDWYYEDEDNLRYTLYKLGFGKLVEEFLPRKEPVQEIPVEKEEPIAQVPSHPIEEPFDGVSDISRIPDHHGPKY